MRLALIIMWPHVSSCSLVLNICETRENRLYDRWEKEGERLPEPYGQLETVQIQNDRGNRGRDTPCSYFEVGVVEGTLIQKTWFDSLGNGEHK